MGGVMHVYQEPRICHADLGHKVAAVTGYTKTGPVAVINSAARHSPQLRAQAAWALLSVGLDAGAVLGALDGVRS